MLKPDVFRQQLSDLVAIQTTPENTEALIQCMHYILSIIPSSAQTQLLREDISPILLAGRELTKTPDILFLVHADVVAGRKEQFVARQRGDLLFGRGASDMKFSIPIGVALLQEHLQSDLPYSYMFTITSDEEIGGFNGASYLATEYGLSPKVLVVLDGGNNFELISSSKGILDLQIKSVGRPAHPCYPYRGQNPINPLLLAGSALLSLFPDSEKISGREGTTLYIEKIEGGNSTDRYSTESSLEAVITHPASEKQQDVLEKVQATLRDVCGNQVTLTVLASGDPVYTNVRSREFQLFQKSVEQVLGKRPRIGIQPGGSDARHFHSPQPIVLMTKPHGGGIHGEREHVSISSSLLLYHALSNFMREYSRK